jgi:hypothetical protein
LGIDGAPHGSKEYELRRERIEARLMSDGKRIQQLIYDWLDRKYPDGPTWYGRSATELPALEIKMIPAFDSVEYNLSNGGWAQFLWNCFGCWRGIINVAREGYLLIGAPEQSAALTTLWALCERDERECAEIQKRAEAEFDEERHGSPPFFAEFTARSYSAPPNDWEPLFHDRDVYDRRLAWLAANEARVRKALGVLD